jgi:hypothetical protein
MLDFAAQGGLRGLGGGIDDGPMVQLNTYHMEVREAGVAQ